MLSGVVWLLLASFGFNVAELYLRVKYLLFFYPPLSIQKFRQCLITPLNPKNEKGGGELDE